MQEVLRELWYVPHTVKAESEDPERSFSGEVERLLHEIEIRIPDLPRRVTKTTRDAVEVIDMRHRLGPSEYVAHTAQFSIQRAYRDVRECSAVRWWLYKKWRRATTSPIMQSYVKIAADLRAADEESYERELEEQQRAKDLLGPTEARCARASIDGSAPRTCQVQNISATLTISANQSRPERHLDEPELAFVAVDEAGQPSSSPVIPSYHWTWARQCSGAPSSQASWSEVVALDQAARLPRPPPGGDPVQLVGRVQSDARLVSVRSVMRS